MYLKEFFEKVILKKKSVDAKLLNYPACKVLIIKKFSNEKVLCSFDIL